MASARTSSPVTSTPIRRAPNRAFIAVNCAGVTETLLESELFGHVKGSFTGAYRDKVGRLQLADRGTIFLDEVGEMSARMQALLLRFLENGEIHPVGSDTSLARVDVRVIAATNRNLDEMVRSGAFRLDLLYRIRVAHLHIPPLRERREDIPLLVRHFVSKLGQDLRFSEEAMKALQRYDWPGTFASCRAWSNMPCSVDSSSPSTIFRSSSSGSEKSSRECRTRQSELGDQLYEQLLEGGSTSGATSTRCSSIAISTRHDLRHLIRRGLKTTYGNYRALLPLFRIPDEDYKRFLNFLATHDCMPNFREFRSGLVADAGRNRPGIAEPPDRPH